MWASRVFLVVGTVLVVSPFVSGCTCLPHTAACEEIAEASDIFIASVVAKPRIPLKMKAPAAKVDDIPSPLDGVRLKVLRTFVGAAEGEVETSPFPMCGFSFEPGKQYLVYATRDSDSRLEVSFCSRTRLLAQATRDVEFWERWVKESHVTGTIYGAVWTWEGDRRIPARGTTVVVKGSGVDLTATTDARGKFALDDVAPGEYEIKAAFGSGKGAAVTITREATVRAGGCARVDFAR